MARDSGAHASGRRTGRRLTVAGVVLVAVAGAAAGAMALSAHGKAQDPKVAGVPSAQTTAVVRTDLSDSQSLTGTLGFGGPTTVGGTGKGVVTRLPKAGSTVARGKPLYWVDDRPVMVFFGDTPMFRTLDKPGVSGRDVTVLAQNLSALGYDIGPLEHGGEPRVKGSTGGAGPTTKLTPALDAALKRWQRDTGQQQTGALDPAQVAVLPGTVRVSGLSAQLGDPAAADVLTVTSVDKAVAVKVDAADSDPIHQGDKVSITLPDTKVVPGEVTSVGQSVQGGGDDEEAGVTGPPSLQVTVTPTHGADVKKLESASVQVRFTTETRKGVLAVPVGALLALREGGYAVQRPDGKLLGVRTGLFAKGMVEVSGQGLAAGIRVVTTS